MLLNTPHLVADSQSAINYESHLKRLPSCSHDMRLMNAFFSLQNFATADRPRCMLRDENYLRQQRQFRSFEYGPDENDETTWYWNMNHQANGNAINQSKKPQHKSKNAHYPSNRSQTSSGFQSFFRWFKKDEKSRGAISDISYPREVTSSTDTLEFDSEQRFQRNSKARRRVKGSRGNAVSPPSSPRFSRAFSQSSSCDSVFSTASSFAFVPPIKYLTNRNQKQVSDCYWSRVHLLNALPNFVLA